MVVGDDVVERVFRGFIERADGPLTDTEWKQLYPILRKSSTAYPRLVAALSALGPDLCIVPRNPTHDMRLAGARSIGATMGMDNHMARAESAYDAMLNVVVLAAAPSLPREDAGDE